MFWRSEKAFKGGNYMSFKVGDKVFCLVYNEICIVEDLGFYNDGFNLRVYNFDEFRYYAFNEEGKNALGEIVVKHITPLEIAMK